MTLQLPVGFPDVLSIYDGGWTQGRYLKQYISIIMDIVELWKGTIHKYLTVALRDWVEENTNLFYQVSLERVDLI